MESSSASQSAIATAQWPFVSIIVPAYNEEAYIEECVRTILAQDYPADRFEVLIADGRSTDRTREILDAIIASDARVKWIDNPERLQAPGLNHLIAIAQGDVIVRMDVHCEYASNYVRACVNALRATGAQNVGGAQRPKAKTFFQEVLCEVLSSPLAVGGAAYRDASKEGFVDTVFLGAFARDTLITLGGYDPHAITNEDAELNLRLREGGGKVYLSRDIEVYYYPRGSYQTLFRQYFKYGQGRARTMLKSRQMGPLRSVASAALVAGAVVTAVKYRKLFATGAAAYAALTLGEAVRVAGKLGPRGVLMAWGMFPTLHLAHGTGLWSGLAKYGASPDWSALRIVRSEEVN